jgi:hypothetical protein
MSPVVRALALAVLAVWAPPRIAEAQSPAVAAQAVLRTHSGSGSYRSLALEQLARSGEAAARAALEKEASTPGAVAERPALLALTRLGDARATARMGAMMGEDPDLETVRALAMSRTDAAGAALVRALGASSQAVRAASAIAIGRLGYAKGADALRRALEDEWLDVRAAATSALYRLGDQSMLALATARLETPMQEAQLAAADAWAPEKAGPWVVEVEPMLRNQTAEIRHAAAERLANVRHEQVAAVLRADLAPEMPDEIRIEAARVAAHIASADDVDWLTRALTDPLPEVQIHVAGAILRVTGRR